MNIDAKIMDPKHLKEIINLWESESFNWFAVNKATPKDIFEFSL
jgi:hypothetical protein